MTSATTPKTIDLGGNSIQREGRAAGAILPGHLVVMTAAALLAVNTVSSQQCQAAFAVEFDLTGRGIADAFAADDQVVYRIFAPGSHVYAWIADGEDIAYGTKLTSNGDGALREAVAGDFVVAEAREASAPSGADARAVVEISLGHLDAS